MTTADPMSATPDEELLWWRTANGFRTTISFFWSGLRKTREALRIEAAIFGPNGEPLVEWTLDLDEEQAVTIDSAAPGPWQAAHGIDGVLALSFSRSSRTETDPADSWPVFPIVTWHRPDGRIATLHSEQSSSAWYAWSQRFTEIVINETSTERNALVILTGATVQSAGSLSLSVRNAYGDSRTAVRPQPMPAHSVTRIDLAALFPGLDEFAAGQPLQVSAAFDSKHLYTRPYVEATGSRWGLYHGGDVNQWPVVDYTRHAFSGELNPIAVMQTDRIQTFINVLHSHDSIADDTWLDVSLFDLDGKLHSRHPRWKCAIKNELTRFAVSELMNDTTFVGHLTLRFAPDAGRPVPHHVQALAEYCATGAVARSMMWSDDWNSELKRARQALLEHREPYRACYQAWATSAIETLVSITNAGHSEYAETATALLTLWLPDRTTMNREIAIGPHATLFSRVTELFPDCANALRDQCAVLVISSHHDLASMAFVEHLATGEVAAEHFLAIADWIGERQHLAAGS